LVNINSSKESIACSSESVNTFNVQPEVKQLIKIEMDNFINLKCGVMPKSFGRSAIKYTTI